MFEHITQTAVLDWESYWCTKSRYSIKKLSYTEYVRDKRFRAHGLAASLSWENFKPRWVPHDDVPEFLASIEWAKTRMVAHNGHFDFLVAAERYGIIPGQYFCTMSAAGAWHKGEVRVGLDELLKFHGLKGKSEGLAATNGIRILPPDLEASLATYACNDVRGGAVLYAKYYGKLPESELRVMDQVFRMFCDPVFEVDLDLVREGFKDALRARIAKLDKAKKISIDGNDDFEITPELLRSRDKFAQALRELGVEPPLKKNNKGQDTYAFAKTDEAFKELLDHPDQRVRDLVEAQIESKSTIALTRALRLFRMGKTGKLAVAYNYGKTRTDRLSGGNKMNLQNFQRGSKLRKAIRARRGYGVCVADSSNIESRGAAWFSQQEDKLELFRTGGDPYNSMATAIYNRPIDRKRTETGPDGEEFYPDFIEGFVGKTAELGLTYGMGGTKFKATCKRGMGGVSVDLDLDFCEYVVQTWRRKHYRIVATWGMLDQWAQLLAAGVGDPIEYMGLTLVPSERRIWFPNGTSLHYPDCQFDEGGQVTYRDLFTWKSLYGGKMLENIIQKLSRDVVVGHQLLRISERYRVGMTTHDELIWTALLDECPEALAWGKQQMCIAPSWAQDWPLAASGGWAENYSK